MSTPNCTQEGRTRPATVLIKPELSIGYNGQLPKVKSLPFVRPKKGSRHAKYWHVKPTGRLFEDRQIGMYYAVEALSFMRAHKSISLLECIIRDMPKSGKRGPLEHFFFQLINEQLTA